jgi:hypothetical protein
MMMVSGFCPYHCLWHDDTPSKCIVIIPTPGGGDTRPLYLCLLALRSSTRHCWMADVVGLICSRFGLGIVGPDNVVTIVGDASLLPIKSKSDGLLLMKVTLPLVGAGWPVRTLLSFFWRHCLTTWCTVLLATSDFEHQASIIACGTFTPVLVWTIHMADLTFF